MKIQAFPAATLLALLFLFSAAPSFARDTVQNYPLQESIIKGLEQGILNASVQLFFAGGDEPAILETLKNISTSRKTNGFGKSDATACEWALFSALIALQERALQEGGNAVINIKSNYKHKEFSNGSLFQCGAGTFVVGVALKGTVAKIE